MTVSPSDQYRSWVEIELDHFKYNIQAVRRLLPPSVEMLQVVKADAYGHGAMEIAREALKNGASRLGVANADEGVQLRVGGIEAPVLILSPSPISEINDIIKYKLMPSVSDRHFAEVFAHRCREMETVMPVHVEIDTGMGRGGTSLDEAVALIQELTAESSISVEGIFSHLASSEVVDDSYNITQYRRFCELLKKLDELGISIPLKHLSNSGGILNFPDFASDMVRPGIMTYGVHPSPGTERKVTLKPVMSFKSRIVLLKEFPPGESIGYGRSYFVDKPSIIATIPVGYGDGYGFVLSNKGEVLIRGMRAPIVGRVSMDMCTVDVTCIPGCTVGDEVVLLGQQGDDYISANEIAGKAETISYEVLCVLGKRAPRVYMDGGMKNSVVPRLRRIFIPGEEKSLARIDTILRSCLQTRACDTDFGDAIFYEMLEVLFGKQTRRLEIRTGFTYDIAVREFSREELNRDESIRDFFRVKTHIEYTKTLRHAEFIIGCACNNEQLSRLFDDERCEYRWLLDGGKEHVGATDFVVERLRIHGRDVPVTGSEETERGLEVYCGGSMLADIINKEVQVEIDIVTRKNRANRMFSVYIVYPTRGIDISFDYDNVPITNVRKVDFFAGKHPYPTLRETPGKSMALSVSRDEWIFPVSGVTFLWDRIG